MPAKKSSAKKPATRPPWKRPGAWSFVYQTGTARTAKLKKRPVDVFDGYVLPRATFESLMKGESVTWRDGDRDIVLERQYPDVIRVDIAEGEQEFTAWAMKGRGIALHVMQDPTFPLILVREQKGRYERLAEIIAT